MVSNQSAVAIDLQQVSKTFADRIHALRDVTLQVQCGEIYFLLGANGAGKTTMLNLILGLPQPDRGEVSVMNRNTRSADARAGMIVGPAPIVRQ